MKNKQKYYNDYQLTPVGIFIITIHLVTAFLIYYYFSIKTPSLVLIFLTIGLGYLTLIGISTAYHRLYSHPSYKLNNKFIEFILLSLGTMTLQSSVKKWAFDHRRHHKNTDTEKDPYNVRKGFWHAHIFWLFTTHEPIDDSVIHDLNKNNLVNWQHKNYYWFAILLNISVCFIVGLITNDMLGAFVFVGFLRLILTYHQTWAINSVAHFFGKKTFSKEATARDSLLLTFIIPSEGNHNFHHSLQADYRNSLKWYGIDPTKWIVKLLAKIGWATNLVEYDKKIILKKMLDHDKEYAIKNLSKINSLPKSLKKAFDDNKDILISDIEMTIDKLYNSINSSYEKMITCKNRISEIRKEKADKLSKKLLKLEKKEAKILYKYNLKKWYQIIDVLLNQKFGVR